MPTTQAQAVAAAKKGAQVLMFGVGPQEAHFEMNTYDIYKKQLTIQGSFINPLTFKDAISLLELEQVQDFLDGKVTGVSKAVVKVGKRHRKRPCDCSENRGRRIFTSPAAAIALYKTRCRSKVAVVSTSNIRIDSYDSS